MNNGPWLKIILIQLGWIPKKLLIKRTIYHLLFSDCKTTTNKILLQLLLIEIYLLILKKSVLKW